MLRDIYKIIEMPESYWDKLDENFKEIVLYNFFAEYLVDLPQDKKNELNKLIDSSDAKAIEKWLTDNSGLSSNRINEAEKSLQNSLNEYIQTLIIGLPESKKNEVILYLESKK